MATTPEHARARATNVAEPESTDGSWGSAAITTAQAQAFAVHVTSVATEQAMIARNLALFPTAIQVRGIFFEGVARIVQQSKGAAALAQLQQRAGVPRHVVAFRHYAHRDFYKLYYLAARLLYPTQSFSTSLRTMARTFFPIFHNSLLGKTMGALMGNQPRTILPLLARAYNLSVTGNAHESELVSNHEIAWKCRVEPVECFEQTFAGIIEGTSAEHAGEATPHKVQMLSKVLRGGAAEYRFQITW